MACFHPQLALRPTELAYSSGYLPSKWTKKKIHFLGSKGSDHPEELLPPVVQNWVSSGYLEVLHLPCGNCTGCRLERSRQWAIRCMNEASLHDRNCFLTLTYRDKKSGDSLNKRDIVLFMKSLREALRPRLVRFFQCGEYGDSGNLPHHHMLLFGEDFSSDRELFGVSYGNRIYRSPLLERLWPHGFSSIGNLTFDSACYVARYVMKKINGPDSADFYGDRFPPFITMSRRPGIGAGFFGKYSEDFYPKDFITFNDGQRIRPPRYYDRLYEQMHGEEALKEVKDKRLRIAQSPMYQEEQTLSRLSIKEQAALFKAAKQKRNLNGNFLANL